MDDHFRAFSFVDRIHELQPGIRIRGSYTIPDFVASFPTALVSEAVGQLAAWAAMAAMDFKCRPVAGIAGSVEFLAPIRPGQVLKLAAELESVDADAVNYGGTAEADGVPILQLQHCVGPMIALEEFDDPEALRARFALISNAGAVPGAFRGLPTFRLDHINGEAGRSRRATLHVPESAPFFGDHFPRRPVFPGALLLNSNLELAAALAAELPAPAGGGSWMLRSMTDVKLRAFTPPGERLELEARLDQVSSAAAAMTVETRKATRLISSARALLTPEPHS